MSKEIKTQVLFEHDKKYLPRLIAGMDEAGRGALAGPLVVAICIMPLDKPIEGIYDSKALSAQRREALYEKIIERAVTYQIMECEVALIDKINILEATKRTMCDITRKMPLKPTFILADYVPSLNLDIEHIALKKGDQTSYNIAAASILAKVYRDGLMKALDEKYPLYDFKTNKGYGTPRHIEAIRQFGKTHVHRESFIKNFFVQQASFFEKA